VREGRRSEFAAFAEFEDEEKRSCIPDPNDPSTFEASIPPIVADPEFGRDCGSWLAWTSSLLKLRHAEIIPRLAGCRAEAAQVLSEKAVFARWRMGDGMILELAINLNSEPVSYQRNVDGTDGRLLFETSGASLAASCGTLLGDALVAFLFINQQ
jgi:maltooligosyltrehalose trehalohydrolase